MSEQKYTLEFYLFASGSSLFSLTLFLSEPFTLPFPTHLPFFLPPS